LFGKLECAWNRFGDEQTRAHTSSCILLECESVTQLEKACA
jgi:hypothetical protein